MSNLISSAPEYSAVHSEIVRLLDALHPPDMPHTLRQRA